MTQVHGIHHVTAIAGDPQENLDFYAGVLGMRLVKKTVNQDVPDTYHLFYADAEGHPGSDLTFFPWPQLPPVQQGTGLAMEVALAVPPSTLEFWSGRLDQYGVGTGPSEVRFGERVLPVRDPHGLPLVLVETSDAREFTAWDQSPVPPEKQIVGLHAVRLWERNLGTTAEFLSGVLGFSSLGEEGGWHRFGITGGGSGKHLDIRKLPEVGRGAWGTGGVHHVAWRVSDEAAQLALRARVLAAGRRPTEVIDRFWFKSVYFLEPGGVLFELATEDPGFAVDEAPSALGERLVLPPWLEQRRRDLEAVLPPLKPPAPAVVG